MKQFFLNIKKVTSLVIYFMTLVILISCGKSEKTSKEKLEKEPADFIPTKLVQQEDKVFKIDSLTDYSKINGRTIDINGKENFVFINWDKKRIYFYDYLTSDLHHTIILQKEGPNGVNILPYFSEIYFHNKDSIFISGRSFHQNLYLINANGELLYKGEMGQKDKSDPNSILTRMNLEFKDHTYFKNGYLHTGIRITRPTPKTTNPIRTKFNLSTLKFEQVYLEEAKIVPNYEAHLALLRKKMGVNMIKHVLGINEEHLFASSQIADSLYEFKGNKFIKAHYAANPAVATSDYKRFYERRSVEKIDNGYRATNKPEQPPHFIGMIIDKDREWIYRFQVHRTSAQKMKNWTKTVVEESSIIAFNIASKKSYVFSVPKELELNFTFKDIFANKNGIHFPTSDQETESEKRYNVYKIE